MQITLPSRLLSLIYALNDLGAIPSTGRSGLYARDLESVRNISVK